MSDTTTKWFSSRFNRVLPICGVFLAAIAFLAFTGRDGLPQPSSEPAFRFGQQATSVAATGRFEFYSDPWINLHHFLYQWARGDEGLGTGRQHVPVQERSTLAELSSEQRRDWLQAIAFYRDSVAARGHFDDQMLQLKQDMLGLGGDPQARPPDEIQGISAALAVAMPVYQARWWADHDQANRAWIAGVVPRLGRHESRYVEMTVRIYGSVWPNGRRRVDVSAYANWAGGYTAIGHIVIYSTDSRAQDLYGLEILLHEVQHTREVGSSARVGLSSAFEVAGTDVPPNLWHALIFATAGAFTQTVAETERLPEHTPYWIREGFQNFRGWSALIPLVREHWLPVVRGEASKEDGFAALVGAYGNPPGPSR